METKKIVKENKNNNIVHANFAASCLIMSLPFGSAAVVDVTAVTTDHKNEMKMLYEFGSSLFATHFNANWKLVWMLMVVVITDVPTE